MPVFILVIFLIIILFCIAVLLFGIGYGAFRISRNTRHYFEAGKDGKCKDYTVVLEGKTKLQQKAWSVIFAVKKVLSSSSFGISVSPVPIPVMMPCTCF